MPPFFLMAKKQGPLYLVAREFIERFPSQKQFGVAATEQQLAKVMAEIGCDESELLWRIRQWSQTRRKIAPWQLAKLLPSRPIKEEKTPVKAPVIIPPVPDEWKKRALWIYQPWEEDLP